MNARLTVCFAFAAATFNLDGCGSVSPPRGDFALIPVSTANSSNIHVESARLAEIDRQLIVTGRVRKLYRNPVGSIHVDVTFLDVERKRIATKTTRVHFSQPRIGPPPAARFSLLLETWPEETAEIIVGPHSEKNHE